MKRRSRTWLARVSLYALVFAFAALAAITADWGKIQRNFFNLEVTRTLFPEILTIAARNTMIFTVLAFTFGLGLALILALMRLSTIGPYRWFATTYIEVFRGLPALLTIFLVGYGIPIAFGRDAAIPGTYGPGMVGLGLVAAAYMAETIRAGIQAVPRGQMEAARSLGMTYNRAMATIVIPQAFRIIIPPMTNEMVLLIKDTSLLFVLGTTPATEELTKFANDGAQQTANSTPYIVAGLVYLALTVPLTRLVALLERRARRAR